MKIDLRRAYSACSYNVSERKAEEPRRFWSASSFETRRTRIGARRKYSPLGSCIFISGGRTQEGVLGPK